MKLRNMRYSSRRNAALSVLNTYVSVKGSGEPTNRTLVQAAILPVSTSPREDTPTSGLLNIKEYDGQEMCRFFYLINKLLKKKKKS